MAKRKKRKETATDGYEALCQVWAGDESHTTVAGPAISDGHGPNDCTDCNLHNHTDWSTPCMNCGDTPTFCTTELCGPCCFGEADTLGGNW